MKPSSSSRKPRTRNNSRKPGRNSGQSNGNRVENRVRGNPKQLLDKYKTQARDARQSGDRISAEYYYQFADHYQRVLNEMRLGCGGVFEDYREPPKRLREQAEGADEELDDIVTDEDGVETVSEDADKTDTQADGEERGGRASRSERAARAEADERNERDGRNSRRGGGRRRRQPAETPVTASATTDDPSAVDQPSIVAEDDSPSIVADVPALEEEIEIVAKPRPRGRPRRKPAKVEEPETAALPLDEPKAEQDAAPETDAA